MSDSFGARLRHQRERQDIALNTIAEQTKIKLSLLDALERDDVSHWPAGIFRRAFVRAYAHAIGLNPDVVVREFLEVYPDPVEVVATPPANGSGADGGRTGAGPPTRLRNLVGSAIGSLSRLRRPPAPEGPIAAGQPEPEHHSGSYPAYEFAPVTSTNEVAAHASVIELSPSQPGPPAVVEPPVEHAQPERTTDVADGRTPVNAPASEPDFLAAAHLCTELGRVESASEVQPLLQEAARVVDAVGLIVWVWDQQAEELRPALAHGYSDKVLAQLPTVKRDTDNATAAAFRSAETTAINGSDHASGALAVPLMTPAGCAGVLAIELQHGSEQTKSVRAIVTIFAAQLAQLVGGAPPPAVRPPADLIVPLVGTFTPSVLCANVRR